MPSFVDPPPRAEDESRRRERRTRGMKQPEILIVGLGGIGGVLAARLLESEHDVTLVTRNREVCVALEQRGLEIIEDGDERRIPAVATTELPDHGRRFDFIILATQPTDVERAS